MYYGSDELNAIIDNSTSSTLFNRLTLSDGAKVEKLESLKYYGGSNIGSNIEIGTTVMAYVECSAFETGKDLTNQEFLLERLANVNGTEEGVPLGYFTIQRPDGDEDEITFTAYDRMIRFERPYVSELTYPTDSTQILNELCTQCEVELATSIDMPITIEENLEGYTCREVLGYIAATHGKFACIDRFGKLNLRWYSDETIEKSPKLVYQLSSNQSSYTIEKVEIHKDSENVFTSGSGSKTLYSTNPFASQNVADTVYSVVGGFTYNASEVEMLDDVRLDPWDVISITNNDVTHIIPCMVIEHDLGACSTEIKSVGLFDEEEEYQAENPTIRQINRLSQTVNSQGQIIRQQGTVIDTLNNQIVNKVWQEDVYGAIDDLQVGGNNLLDGSKDLSGNNFFAEYNLIDNGNQLTLGGYALCM